MQSKTRNALGMFNAGLLDAEDIGRIGGEVEELLGSTDNAAKVLDAVLLAREEAVDKALDSLARYKFEMFGYWASAFVKYNQLLPSELKTKANPFKDLVKVARGRGFGPGVSRQKGGA